MNLTPTLNGKFVKVTEAEYDDFINNVIRVYTGEAHGGGRNIINRQGETVAFRGKGYWVLRKYYESKINGPMPKENQQGELIKISKYRCPSCAETEKILCWADSQNQVLLDPMGDKHIIRKWGKPKIHTDCTAKCFNCGHSHVLWFFERKNQKGK